MSVNLGTEFTCSHALTSKEAREARVRARSTHPSQGKRSCSGYVFRRLGRGAEMRDTLNLRRDQEQSQQSIAQNKQPKLGSKSQREIPVEDSRQAIAAMRENDVEFIVATRRYASKAARRVKTSGYQGV